MQSVTLSPHMCEFYAHQFLHFFNLYDRYWLPLYFSTFYAAIGGHFAKIMDEYFLLRIFCKSITFHAFFFCIYHISLPAAHFGHVLPIRFHNIFLFFIILTKDLRNLMNILQMSGISAAFLLASL